jgi:hypothetical protein
MAVIADAPPGYFRATEFLAMGAMRVRCRMRAERNMTKSERWGIAALIALVVGVLLLRVAYGCIKADSYNRVTGSHVSAWDAQFLDLRVLGQEQK